MTHKEKIRRIKDRRLHWLRKIKKSKGCENCGYNESPLALDFAHINPLDKNIAMCGTRHRGCGMHRLVVRICTVDKEKNTFYIKELFDEIRKCKILCKNCHVVETYNNKEFNGEKIKEQRGGSYKMRKHGQKIEERGNLTEFFN